MAPPKYCSAWPSSRLTFRLFLPVRQGGNVCGDRPHTPELLLVPAEPMRSCPGPVPGAASGSGRSCDAVTRPVAEMVSNTSCGGYWPASSLHYLDIFTDNVWTIWRCWDFGLGHCISTVLIKTITYTQSRFHKPDLSVLRNMPTKMLTNQTYQTQDLQCIIRDRQGTLGELW